MHAPDCCASRPSTASGTAMVVQTSGIPPNSCQASVVTVIPHTPVLISLYFIRTVVLCAADVAIRTRRLTSTVFWLSSANPWNALRVLCARTCSANSRSVLAMQAIDRSVPVKQILCHPNILASIVASLAIARITYNQIINGTRCFGSAAGLGGNLQRRSPTKSRPPAHSVFIEGNGKCIFVMVASPLSLTTDDLLFCDADRWQLVRPCAARFPATSTCKAMRGNGSGTAQGRCSATGQARQDQAAAPQEHDGESFVFTWHGGIGQK